MALACATGEDAPPLDATMTLASATGRGGVTGSGGGVTASAWRFGGGLTASAWRFGGGLTACTSRLGGGVTASISRLGGGVTACTSRLGGGVTASISCLGGGVTASVSRLGGGVTASISCLGGGVTASISCLGGGVTASVSRLGGGVTASISRLGGGVTASSGVPGSSASPPPTGPSATTISKLSPRGEDLSGVAPWMASGSAPLIAPSARAPGGLDTLGVTASSWLGADTMVGAWLADEGLPRESGMHHLSVGS